MKIKAKTKFWDAFLKTLNLFIFPLFFVGIFAILILNYSSPQGAMPHIFGISVVRIESGSMVEKGFAVGDVVFMNQNFKKPLKVGDIIGFYNKKDNYDLNAYNITSNLENSSLVLFKDFEGEFAKNISYNGRITPQKLIDEKHRITFHEIINVYVSPDGIIFYQTQGSNPDSSPDGFIRQDFVLAKYLHTPLIIKAVMSFTLTPLGSIFFVFAPFSLIVGVEGYKTLKKIYAYQLESKVFNRKVSFKDEKAKDYKVGQLMSLPKKVYFWITTKKDDKNEAFNFLFQIVDEKSVAQINEFENALKSKKIFEKKGPLEYFKFWHLTAKKNFDKKEIIKFQKQYEEAIKQVRSKF